MTNDNPTIEVVARTGIYGSETTERNSQLAVADSSSGRPHPDFDIFRNLSAFNDRILVV